MKICILDGIIVCSLENRNSEFLSETSGCFDDFHEYNLKLRTDDFRTEFNSLKTIIIAADKHGIEVSKAVRKIYHLYSEWQGNIEREREEQRRIEAIEAEERKKREEWLSLQKNGCRGCENCRAISLDDDYKCLASGDMLPVENRPGYEGLTYHLFNLKPFPTDGCPYRYETNLQA